MISETFFTAEPRKTHELHSSCSTQTRNRGAHVAKIKAPKQWRRQDFVTRGGVRYGSIGGLEYEVPLSRLYCLCINVALCSTALQCVCRVIRRSSMTMKAHILHNFWTSTHRGEASPLAAPLLRCLYFSDMGATVSCLCAAGRVQLMSFSRPCCEERL